MKMRMRYLRQFSLSIICLAVVACSGASETIGHQVVYEYNSCKFLVRTETFPGLLKSNDGHFLDLWCKGGISDDGGGGLVLGQLKLFRLEAHNLYSFDKIDSGLIVRGCPSVIRGRLLKIQNKVDSFVGLYKAGDFKFIITLDEDMCINPDLD